MTREARDTETTMPELGFDEVHRPPVIRNREFSPDSVVFTGESNFSSSLFSSSASASASVGRCSFASSDAAVIDHDSDISPHLARLEISSGPDSDPNKSNHYKKAEKAKDRKDNDYLKEPYSRNDTVESARSSFSLAIQECQERRSKSVALLRKQDRRRPASLDLNNHHVTAATSPRLGVMTKGSIAPRRNATALSPGTPNYGLNNVPTRKGWSSERVLLRNNANRKTTNASLFPFSNGRTLPSKWEDAERWIISPNAGDGVSRNSVQHQQRRPKSKSGPLGPPGIAYSNPLHSPIMPNFEGSCVGNLVGGSRLMVPDGFSIRSSLGSNGAAGTFAARVEPYMARSISIHGCTEMINRPTHQGDQVEIMDSDKDGSTNISRVISRRDMATQMSPASSSSSSPISRLSFSLATPLPILELETIHSSKSDVRDVQIDEKVNVTRWSKKNRALFNFQKKNRALFPGILAENSNDWRRKASEDRTSAWDVSEAGKSISKIKREEAKINAWENLQKAKAEAAIRKLEMRLEKKRSSSMDRIMNKLRSAQKKAQEMRSSMLNNKSHQVRKTSYKVASLRRPRQISSLSGCFTCYAF